MSKPDDTNPPPIGQFLVYPTEDGQTKIEVRLENETVWLTQQHLAALFQTTKQNVSLHLQNIFAERELEQSATVKESLTVQIEGARSVQRRVQFYNLDAFLSVNDRNILTHAGKVSHDMAKELAEGEYDKFNLKRIQHADQAGGDFEKAIKQLSPPHKQMKGRQK